MAELPQRAQSPYLNLDAAFTMAYDIVADGTAIYLGWAKPGTSNKANAVWRLCKVVLSSGDPTDKQWADGNDAFDNVWNNRASLTYS